MVEYNGVKYQSIHVMCINLNIDEKKFKEEYNKCKDIDLSMQKFKHGGDIDIKAIKSLKELANSLEIDYNTLLKNIDRMDLDKAIQKCREDKYKQSEEYINMLKEFITEHGEKYNITVPDTDKTIRSTAQKLYGYVKDDEEHSKRIPYIKKLITHFDENDEVIRYLLKLNYDYENIPCQSKELCNSLYKIIKQKEIGNTAEYDKIKSRYKANLDFEISKICTHIGYMLENLNTKNLCGLKTKHKELFDNYTKSIDLAEELSDIIDEAYKIQKMNNEISDVDYDKMLESLRVTLKLKNEWIIDELLDKNLPKTFIINIIQENNLIALDLFELALKEKKRSFRSFIYAYKVKPSNLLEKIGIWFTAEYNDKPYSDNKMRAVNSLVNIALKLILKD